MDSSDWKTVSTHYIRATIVKSIENQKIDAWQPTLLIAASEDALAMARILRDELKARGSQPIPVLNRKLELFNDSNPYNEHTSPYQGSFSGRVLLVDKADNTRASIAAFINQLKQGKFAEARAASPETWMEPQLAVFVLHNKRRTKTADLPDGVVEFVGEETDDVHIAYATSTHTEEQPQAHHTHPSGVCQRVPSKGFDPNFRRPSPAPISPLSTANSDILRSVSSHYVETILEKAVEEQHLQERFGPTMLVAASDGALAPARLLRHYLRHRTGHPERPADQTPPQHDLPLLTPRLELYDEDTNPYLAHIMGVKEWGAASLAGQHVLVVDRVDNTRTTLASFIAKLEAAAAGARAEAEAQGRPWAGNPLIGVFVLHNKQVDKQADLPADILEGRYFYGEITDGSTLLYPFNI